MTTQDKLIKAKLNLPDLAEYLGNVSEAYRQLGYSRDTFYRVKNLYEEGGLEALRGVSRRTPNIRSRVPEEVEKAVIGLAIEYPAHGQVRIASKLAERGISIPPAGARRCVWQRHGLETMKKQLRTLEEKYARAGSPGRRAPLCCARTEKPAAALAVAVDDRQSGARFPCSSCFPCFMRRRCDPDLPRSPRGPPVLPEEPGAVRAPEGSVVMRQRVGSRRR
jgi:hypothetical protein